MRADVADLDTQVELSEAAQSCQRVRASIAGRTKPWPRVPGPSVGRTPAPPTIRRPAAGAFTRSRTECPAGCNSVTSARCTQGVPTATVRPWVTPLWLPTMARATSAAIRHRLAWPVTTRMPWRPPVMFNVKRVIGASGTDANVVTSRLWEVDSGLCAQVDCHLATQRDQQRGERSNRLALRGQCESPEQGRPCPRAAWIARACRRWRFRRSSSAGTRPSGWPTPGGAWLAFLGSSASERGSVTWVERMFACPEARRDGGGVRVGCSPPLVVWPPSANPIRTLGANRSAAQPVAPNGTHRDRGGCPASRRGWRQLQTESDLVGLTMNPARSIATSMLRIRSGIPPTTCGKGSETIVTCASVLSICNAARVTHCPEVERPRNRGYNDR